LAIEKLENIRKIAADIEKYYPFKKDDQIELTVEETDIANRKEGNAVKFTSKKMDMKMELPFSLDKKVNRS